MTDFDCLASESLLLTIDVQERFVGAIPSIADDQPVGKHLQMLIGGCSLLAMPTFFSEQVPEKLGSTLPSLLAAATNPIVFSKSAFSCIDDSELRTQIASADRPHIIIGGIESHVCVLGTVDDLLRRNYRVTVAVDTLASRNPDHVSHAISTMRQLGAICLPTESIVMRLQRDAANSRFRDISKLIR